MDCIKCGSFIWASFKTAPLKDGLICLKCFEELGFDPKEDRKKYKDVTLAEIADGKETYINRCRARYIASQISVKATRYGEERDLEAEDAELEIFDILQELAEDVELELVRKSDNYLTAKCGEWDLARFKYTDRTHWIFFPTKEQFADRHKISSADDVYDLADEVQKSLAHIEKYSD